MDTIFMNSGNSKTPDPRKLLLSLSDKINWKISHKYVTLSNLAIHGKIKKSYKNNKFKISLWHGMKNLNYLTDHILYQIFKIILNIS